MTRLLKCPKCGYEWETQSERKWVTCPNGQHKFDSTNREISIVVNNLEHFNVDETGVRILDKSLATKYSPKGRIVDVDFKSEGAWCEHCERSDCVHVKYALQLPIVKRIVKKKGWKIDD